MANQLCLHCFKILSQSPKAGNKVRTNKPIHLVLSRGPKMVQVSDVLYMTQTQLGRDRI